MEKRITLKETLRHERYRWPLTLLTYDIRLDVPVKEGEWSLWDEDGRPMEFQVTEMEWEDGLVKNLRLHFLCALGSGEEKTYTFRYGEGWGSRIENTFSSDFILKEDGDGRGFSVANQGASIHCRVDLSLEECQEVRKGSLFHEMRMRFSGSAGQRYVLHIRRIKGMPFWELRETMSGFTGHEEMKMAFEGFDFTRRYSWKRPVEAIDRYLTQDNRIPVILMPYENWVPWFQSKHIAFLGKGQSAGLFIRDNMEWDDTGYPIWGARKEFGATFSWEDNRVEGHFPLKNGTRFWGISIYPGSDSHFMEKLWLWYAFLNLDKTKDWILDWREEKDGYPKFFDRTWRECLCHKVRYCEKGRPIPADTMEAVIDKYSPSMNHIEDLNPVDNREFDDWTVIFDLTASDMEQEAFDRAKAAFAFMAYATMDENYMPTVHMLAGHPNFLCDTASVSGFFSALFPNHPEQERFRSYFARVVSQNLKYHIRPDVAAYQSLGGRATENLGCYNFAALRPIMRVSSLYRLCGYEQPLDCWLGEKWLNWMTNCLSAPVNGRRIFPPQGAHAAKYADGYLEIPYMFYQFAQLLKDTYPKEASCALGACGGSPLNAIEYEHAEDDIWRTLVQRDEEHREVDLASEAFTGYGYILREGVGTEREISIHIQQLDRGPNYRWGTFCNTGNGGIHYFAAGKRYSFNCLEDTGDRNLGAEEGNCGFSVLKGHTYYNIGFHDLTEPLICFPLAKQAKLLAEESIQSFYRYRRVTLVESDYIVLYDAVSHMRNRGRFIWTVGETEEFPAIYPIKPGSAAIPYVTKGAVDMAGDDGLTRKDARYRSKTVAYDGDGDFLTIVSHRKDLQAEPADYGARVILPDREDRIFEDSAKIRYRDDCCSFCGYSGVLSFYKNGQRRGAMLDAASMELEGIVLTTEGRCSVFFEKDGENGADKGRSQWHGIVSAWEDVRMTVNGKNVRLKRGVYDWNIEEELSVSRRPDREYRENREFVRDTRRHEFGFYGTDFWEEGEVLSYPQEDCSGNKEIPGFHGEDPPNHEGRREGI